MASGFPRTFSRFQELRQPSVGGSKRWQPRVVIKLVGVRTLRWHRVNPSRERGVLGRSLPIGGEQKREVGALPKTFAFPAINEMAGATHPGELSRYEIFQTLVPQEQHLTTADSAFSFLALACLKPGVSAHNGRYSARRNAAGLFLKTSIFAVLGSLVPHTFSSGFTAPTQRLVEMPSNECLF